jgi:trehalose 6-phosphate phosphatase
VKTSIAPAGDPLASVDREVLAHFARSNVLAAFDYDGTLAPIAALPHEASMRVRTRDLFRRVCDSFPTVVISGRAQTDLEERLRGVGVFAIIGNHGIEPWQARRAYRRLARGWLAALRRALSGESGVWLEDKRFSVAVHYRQAPALAEARRTIVRAASALEGARIVSGKRVVNLMPRDAPTKGAALEMARVMLGCDAAIYVGDDDPDEDVFRLQTKAALLTIRVGGRRNSRATFRLENQRGIDALLGTLVQLRRESDGSRRLA